MYKPLKVGMYVKIKDLSHNQSAYKYEYLSNMVAKIIYAGTSTLSIDLVKPIYKRIYSRPEGWQSAPCYREYIPKRYVDRYKYVRLID